MGPAKLSVFDLDRTLIRINSSFIYCITLCCKGAVPFSYLFASIYYYFRHRFCKMSLEHLHRSVFNKLLRGLPKEVLESHVEDFVEQKISRSLHVPTFERLKLAQKEGQYTVILSNSPSFLVRAIAEYFGVDEWKSTEYAVDKDQKICHISSLMQGEDKARCALQIAERWNISKDSITAYSDSYFDLPLLLAAGNAVAVNPDKKLREVALKQHWEILY
jgi:HAD superfamily hydrolase (TIGR01490 family)